MLKRKTKFIILLLACLLLFSSFSFATDEGIMPISETSEQKTIEPRDTENAGDNVEPEIHNGDLYLFDNHVVMDQLVDGNVFIFGKDVEITGKINGSLFVCAENLTFEKESYVIQAIYACANNIYFNGAASDLYAACRLIDMSYDSFVQRDIRVGAETFNFNGCAGRNVFVSANNFNFITTENAAALIYGDLTYSASQELNLSKEFVQGNVIYKQYLEDEGTSTGEIIIEKVTQLCSSLLYVAIVFILVILLAPKFVEKASSYIAVSSTAKSFGIGILAVVLAVVVSFALLFSVIGIPVSFAIIALLVLLLSISTAVTSICITYKLKEKFAYNKDYLTYLTLAGVVVVIWALKIIPYVGSVISFVVKMIGLGIIIYYLLTKNKSNKNIEKSNVKEIKEKNVKKEDTSKKKTTTKKENKKKEE